MTPEQAIARLRKYIHVERKKLPWLKNRQSMLDCAAAVSWVLGWKPEIISCGDIVDKYTKAKRWYTTGIPKPGDIIVFDWHTGKGMGKGNINHDHVGIVEKADKKMVTYVSADSTKPVPGLVTDNAVEYKWVLGYGRPQYK